MASGLLKEVLKLSGIGVLAELKWESAGEGTSISRGMKGFRANGRRG